MSHVEDQFLKEISMSTADMDDDDKILAQMGYKQQLHRGFNALMSFSFCFTAVGAIASTSLLFTYGINTGGPAVMVWGWIIASIFTTIVASSMAEICSSYPSAGSVYHWAGILAPEKWAPASAYICGWFNFLGNAASGSSFAYGFASFISACVAISTNEGVVLDQGIQVCISIAILFFWALNNMLKVDTQGWVNNISALY